MGRNDSIQDKRNALSYALGKTDALMDEFLKVLKQNPDEKSVSRNFDETASKLIVDEKPIEEPVATEEKPKEDERLHMSFSALLEDALKCKRCGLCDTRNNVVFGMGCADRPLVMVIGEGPGENEDLQGLPFVGKAGQFLDKWLAAINLSREKDVYITNVVKCRPPQNRAPFEEESLQCFAYLKQQIELVQPRSILCLGKSASAMMTGQKEASMASLRGRFFFYDSIPMLCTYHPAAVLRDLELKRPVWDDLKKLARYLGLEVGGR